MRAWIGLGANLQQPIAQLKEAIRRMAAASDIEVLATSSFYRTPPWGDEQQSDFVNAVVLLETSLQPLDLLHQLQAIENDMGRVRKGRRWGPRLIDIDILLYEQLQIKSDELTVPHPHMHERAFVLLPITELDPKIEIPGKGRVDELLNAIGQNGIEFVDSQSVD